MDPTEDDEPGADETAARIADVDRDAATRRTKFILTLLVILMAGITLRFGVLIVRPMCLNAEAPPDASVDECYYHNGDGFSYRAVANLIANEGEWFKILNGQFRLVDTAQHPPLYSLYLAGWSKMGFDSVEEHRMASALAGASVIPLVGLIGRRARSDRAGLIGAGLAAAYPMLWVNEGQLLSESIYAPIVAGIILAGYRFADRPTTKTAGVLGALIGLAALVRPETLGLYALMVLPLIWPHRHLSRLQQASMVGVAVAISALVLAPWVAFNLSRFEKPVLISTGSGQSLRLTNCDRTYYGEYLGYRHIDCWSGDPYAGMDLDESEYESLLRGDAMFYIDAHRDRLPVVMAARVARLWDIYAPRWNNRANILIDRRGRVASTTGLLMYAAMIPAAIAGLVNMRRRRVPLSPLLAMAVLVSAAAAMTFGLTRYRLAADVALVIAAGVGIDYILTRLPAVHVRLRTSR